MTATAYPTRAAYLAALELDAINWLLTDDSYRRLPVPGVPGGWTADELDAETLTKVNA